MRRTLIAALLVAALVVAPAVLSGGLVGSPGAETMGHAWVRWWSTAAWPDAPIGTDLASGAAHWPVIDPLPTWIFSALAACFGHTAGWNLGVFTGAVVTSLGGAALARSLGGSPIFGAIATPLMPIYLGSVESGLTEDHFLGVVAFALAFGIQKRWLTAALFVGLSAWCGLYLGWFAAIGLAVLALAEMGRAALDAMDAEPVEPTAADPTPVPRGIRALLRPFAALLLAAALSLTAAAPFSVQLRPDVDVQRPPVPAAEPYWRLNPWRGADLASFVAPGKEDPGDVALRSHPVYLGVTTLSLAVLGGSPVGMLAVGACALASLGDEVVMGGSPTGVGNPFVAVLRALPMGERFRNHARIMLLGQLILVGLASRGAARVGAASSLRVGPLLAALAVAAEVAILSPARLPLSTTPAEPPEIYALVPSSELPMRVMGARNPQAPLFHQRFHGHRLLNDPNRPPDMPRAGSGEIVVAFGDLVAILPGTLGPPDATVGDSAAWWP